MRRRPTHARIGRTDDALPHAERAAALEPGRVQCHSTLQPGVLDLARFPGRIDDTCERIAAIQRMADANVAKYGLLGEGSRP